MRVRSSRQVLLSLGAAALLAAHAAPAFATQAFDGRVGSETVNPFDETSDQWTAGQIRNLHASQSFDSGSPVIPFATSQTSIDATWNSANSGSVTISGGVTVSQGARIDDSIGADEASVFSYRFTADTDGVLNFDLKDSFTGQQDDIGTWQIAAIDTAAPDQALILNQDGYPFDSNSFELTDSFQLTAGHFYEFDLTNSGSSSNFVRAGFIQGQESGTMNWSIVSNSAGVPEPMSWALMLVGFGGVGALLRRRARALTA